MVVAPMNTNHGPSFPYDTVEGQTEGARKARRAAPERPTGLGRAPDPPTGPGPHPHPPHGTPPRPGRPPPNHPRTRPATCAGKWLAKEIRQTRSPLQISVGQANSCETAYHAALCRSTSHPDHVFIGLDLQNAFNSVDRRTLLHNTATLVPALSAYTNTFHARPPTLLWKGDHHHLNFHHMSS